MSKDAFALQYQDLADKIGNELGVPPRAVLAQLGLETGWGKSIIPGTNNLGNIKDFSGKGVSAVDNLTKSRDKYRAYDSPEAFADDYTALIKRRYPKAVGQKTAQGFAQALKDGGYAEDPDYVQKVVKSADEDYVPVKGPKAGYNEVVSNALQSSVMRPTSARRFTAELQSAAAMADLQGDIDPTLIERFGAAMSDNTDSRLYSGIVEGVWGPKFEVVEGFVPDLKALPLMADSELISDYAGAKSPMEANAILKDAEDEQARVATMMHGGTLSGMSLALASEGASVTNWVAPFAAARGLAAVGKGSLVLAREGRVAASVASSVGENLLSGTAIEAVAQGLKGRFNGQDLAISLTADSLIGLGTGAWGVRALRRAETALDRAAIQAVEQEAHYADRAVQQLGVGASSGDLRKVMDELYKADLNDTVKNSLNDVPESAKLIKAPLEQSDVSGKAAAKAPEVTAQFEEPGSLLQRAEDFAPSGKFEYTIEARTGGKAKTLDELHALGGGVHYASGKIPPAGMAAVDTSYKLARQFLGGDFVLTVQHTKIPMRLPDGSLGYAHADVAQVSSKAAMIRVDPNMSPAQQVRSIVHEIGHVVFNKNISRIPEAERAVIRQSFLDMLKRADAAPTGAEGRAERFSVTNVDQGHGQVKLPKLESPYERNWDEHSAEQYVKYVEENRERLGLAQSTIKIIKEAIDSALAFFRLAKRNHVGVSDEYKAFFDAILAKEIPESGAVPTAKAGSAPVAQASIPAKPADVVQELMTDPDAIKYGLTTLPVGTPAERKHAQAMLALHKQAAEWEVRNPMDAEWERKVKNLADNNVFNVASTGLLMLKSANPLVRMIASELVEDASGVAVKRRATAAISKYMTERFMLGNALNDVQGAYGFWKKDKPGGFKDDMIGGANWAAFNREVASEIEARRAAKAPVSNDPNIKAAADTLEAAYTRIANAQKGVNTLGSEGLPDTSVGYMPHKMSPKAVINMTNEQSRILHSALVDQFVTIEGWDMSFSDRLASTYMQRVRARASGDYGSNVGGVNPGTSSQVEEALRAMDIPEKTIQQHMDKFNKGGAAFTKGRIELDLNQSYKMADGSEFRLLDIFETNQLELLRSQVGRASGEVALTKFGVRGKPGLKLLRDSMEFGADGHHTAPREKEAFDQMAAEFMNEPFGTQSGKFMERAMAANTLVRLGGIAFNQIAESVNGIFHVGAGRTMASIGAVPRLRAEIKALARGEKIDNSFLSSIEAHGGAEFGTDPYKVVMPFDSPDHAYPTYGQDTLTLTDRLLRGGGYLQGKLSGWRMVHSAQQRGMAEQIVKKIARYVKEGTNDTALRDMGITPEVHAALKADIDKVAPFDAAGNPLGFDVTKITDPDIREQVIQSVWRGTSQIIQGTFIGEKGKWAHDGWLKMMTQFRTFSITSMEKQWGRQRNRRGSYAAFGMLVGSMSMAAPVYMARVYSASIGRPDQEAYIEERLQPEALARATLNYVAMAGMAGDFIDLLSATLPDELGVKPTGGRAGVETDFVGNYVLPASSLVDDIWKYAQSPLEADDAARILPMSRLPFLIPLVNATKD